MKHLLKYLSFFIPLLSTVQGFSQVNNDANSQNKIKFTRLTTKQGLASNKIACILQDKNGIIWLGTNNGLYKYDGYKFTVYQNDPGNPSSISNNVIRDIYEDKSGTLWVGTKGGGLNKFDKYTEKFTVYQNDPC